MSTALLSVYHKNGIVDFAKALLELGWDLLASGGTARALREGGLRVRDVAELVGGGAILGHRVVTLSREVHAGLLARLSEDADEMASLGLSPIELVCVDLYPMGATIAAAENSLAAVIDMTDIGGPAMLRSAAKGNRVVVCDPNDRFRVLRWLRDGRPDEDEMINSLAAKAEYVVAQYCLASARYRSSGKYDGLLGMKSRECCYAENRHQNQSPAALFTTGTDDPLALDRFEVIEGSDPSYINWTDVNRLLQTITHIAAVFDKNRQIVPFIAVGCKHGNPCGAAIGTSPEDAIHRMAVGDPLALFGGIVMTNFAVSALSAEKMLTAGGKRVLDGVVAPKFFVDAKKVLRRSNDRCRLYENSALSSLSVDSLDTSLFRKPVRGAFLRQSNYNFVLDISDPKLAKTKEVSGDVENDMLLAWAIGSTSNSNTVTLVKHRALVGNGIGQQDRVGCCKLAVSLAERGKHNIQGASAYSDSFFPFADGPEVLANAGVMAILASSGSVNDAKVLDFCAKRNVALWRIPDATGRGFFGH